MIDNSFWLSIAEREIHTLQNIIFFYFIKRVLFSYLLDLKKISDASYREADLR